MPPKFMSSKISSLWKTPQAAPTPSSGRPAKRSRRGEDNDDDDDLDNPEYHVTSEQLRKLVATRKSSSSERTALAAEMGAVKKNKGTVMARSMNYAELQKKQKRLRELEAEQAERDKELGGGSAIIRRTTVVGKKKKQQKASLKEGMRMENGMVRVGKKTIEANSSRKKR